MKKIITLTDISLTFQEKAIFENFNLLITQNEKIVLKGDSGAGKTTLLNIIMGFVLPTSGDVEIAGEKLMPNSVRNIRSKIAWLPQELSVLGRGKTRDLVKFPFIRFQQNHRKMPSDETFLEHFERLGLEESIYHEDYSKASGGEKQRIGIIVCKLLKSQILLMDEPTSALDTASKELVIDYIMSDDSQTVVSCSHDEDWVRACDRIIPLSRRHHV